MYPQRPWQHQAETAAYRLLESVLPGSWILRQMTERDYGLDCLLEITDEEGRLAGQSCWIQLKAHQHIRWSQKGSYRLGDIKKTTTNYWRVNNGPVFIILADLSRQELFFLCTEHYIKRHYCSYISKGRFPYYFNRLHDRFDTKQGLERFALQLQTQAGRRRLEAELTIFLSNLGWYRRLGGEAKWSNQEYQSGAGLYSRHIIDRNYRFLCAYFSLGSPPQSQVCKPCDKTGSLVNGLKQPDSGVIEIYQQKELAIIKSIRGLLNEELCYWSLTNPELYYYVYLLTNGVMAMHRASDALPKQ